MSRAGVDLQDVSRQRPPSAWWLIPALMLLVAVFNLDGYRGAVAWSAVVAAAACVLVITATASPLASFVTIFSVMTLLTYPVAAILNLLLAQPVVRPDLWVQTDLAMWACAVGGLSMAVGVYVAGRRKQGESALREGGLPIAPVWFNLGLFGLLPAVVWAKLNLGLYYHSAIQPYNFSAQHYLNSLEHLSWIAYAGIFLQVARFVQTDSRWDGLLAAGMTLIALMLFFPSGNRAQAMGFLPLLLIGYLSWEPSLKRKLWLVCAGSLAILVLFYGMAIYRSPDLAGHTLPQKVLRSIDASSSSLTDNTRIQFQVVHRLSEYVATARIIATTPSEHSYRLFAGMTDWWQILVPGFMRPKGAELNFMEGAETTLRYGVSENRASSTPVMLLGDLFSRFGWSGIVAGMFLLGFVLKKMDKRVTQGLTVHKVLFFALFVRIVWQLHTHSVLLAFVNLTRELVVVYVISLLLSWGVSRFKPRPASSP